jgi:hypothetical protein
MPNNNPFNVSKAERCWELLVAVFEFLREWLYAVGCSVFILTLTFGVLGYAHLILTNLPEFLSELLGKILYVLRSMLEFAILAPLWLAIKLSPVYQWIDQTLGWWPILSLVAAILAGVWLDRRYPPR